MSVSPQRPPLANEEAEQAVLGSMLLDGAASLQAIEVLKPEDFYILANRLVFSAIADLNGRGQGVDLVTLSEELRRRGHLEEVGGVSYLAELAAAVPSPAHVQHYARIVSDKATLRDLANFAATLLSRTQHAEDDPSTLLNEGQRQLSELVQRRPARGFAPLREVLDRTLDQIEFLYHHKGEITGVPTGFSDFDTMTAGLQPSDLIIVAARPSIGKTAWTLNVARYAAVEKKKTVGFFSLEMGAEQLAMRLLAAEATVDSQRLRTGQLSEDHWRRLGHALARLSEAPLYIDDTPNIPLVELRARARRLQQDFGLDLILIDYLQLMSAGGRAENRQQEISEISRTLKALARELKVPIVALSQLSRAVESRTDKRPMLSDLRECLTGDSLVALASGEVRPIAELVGKNPRVVTLDGWRITTAEAARVWKVGERPVYLLTTRTGRTVRATANHPFRQIDGWAALANLKPGDRIAIPRSYPSTDVFWDEVKNIEPAGTAEVYDMEVPGTHNFVANGIVVHNSGAIEQDADLVAFLYRDDYYNPETEKPNIAEVLIAKQRNGPTGKVELLFMKEFGKFVSIDRQHRG